MSDIDDELQGLLDQLDDNETTERLEEEINKITESKEVFENEYKLETDEDTIDSVEEADVDSLDDTDADAINDDLVDGAEIDPTDHTLKPVDTRKIDDLSTVTIDESTEDAPAVDITKYHERLDEVTDEILKACRSDRQEAQDVIELLRLQIDDAINKSQSPQRMWVDGLVKAVEVKAGINATAVKIVEANAKMLAATRAGVNILNQNVNTGSEDLEEVLSRPMTEIDEY